MKYVNAKKYLPKELIEEIKKYVEGVYLYIPVTDTNRYIRTSSESQKGLEMRNKRLYDSFLKGTAYDVIAEKYFLSEKSIRRIVLAKKREMEKIKNMIKEALKQWGIQAEPEQINHSSWNVNDEYVIKVYTSQSQLNRNIELIGILYDSGIPVPKVVKTLNGEAFVDVLENKYILTTKLSGVQLENADHLDATWFFKFGEILANLHMGFRQCEATLSFWNNSMLEEMKGWVVEGLNQYKPDYLKVKDIEDSVKQLESVYKKLPKQLIHRDVHVGNFLFDKDEFSGYIDFDLSQNNVRIFDICYFLLGLVSKESGIINDEKRWFEQIEAVIKGYHSIIELTKEEKESIACVMKNIELLFVAYFLGQHDEILARDAGTLFNLVKANESLINDIACNL